MLKIKQKLAVPLGPDFLIIFFLCSGLSVLKKYFQRDAAAHVDPEISRFHSESLRDRSETQTRSRVWGFAGGNRPP